MTDEEIRKKHGRKLGNKVIDRLDQWEKEPLKEARDSLTGKKVIARRDVVQTQVKKRKFEIPKSHFVMSYQDGQYEKIFGSRAPLIIIEEDEDAEEE